MLLLGIADARDARANPDEYLQVYGATIDDYLSGSHRMMAWQVSGSCYRWSHSQTEHGGANGML
jgi:hypothetical protein